MNKWWLTLCAMMMYVGVNAQDLTGRWVVVTGYNSKYYAELYLIRNQGDKYGGHSYDTENNGFCRHWLDAEFDTAAAMFTGKDVELIDKSSGHEATDYRLRYVKEGDQEFLVGTQTITPLQRNREGGRTLQDLMNERLARMFGEMTSAVKYVKVSEDYVVHTPAFPNVMSDEEIELRKAEFPELYEDESVDEPMDDGMVFIPPPPIKEIPEPKDAPREEADVEDNAVVTPPVEDDYVADTEEEIVEKRSKRTDVVAAHIRIPYEVVTLQLRDYGQEDNDRVSVFYNDVMIADNLDLTHVPVEYELRLEAGKRNELVIVANNLGEIPPNTAQVHILVGERSYNYRLFTDESKNALILLESY
ncbi:MAG: hypothetical protein Q4F57_01955 [Weeksellaceae bacterium]|nr:hypothetical protein [Weeksellaceae bacterium]